MRYEALLLTPLLLALPLAAAPRPLGAGAPSAGSGTTRIYVGTYGGGIVRLELSPWTAQPGTHAVSPAPPRQAARTEDPSFLALHPNGRVLYAANEVDSFQGRPTGAVSAFAIDPVSGDLRLLNQQSSEGSSPCHLSVDRAGRNLLVANYGGGTVAVLPLDASGRLQPASSVQKHQGSGPNRERQEKPHAHGIYLDPAERFALATDLGADRVFVYAYDAAKGTLTPHGEAKTAPGAGPRHLAFDPAGRHLYVIDELSSDITVFDYDAAGGSLRAVQTVPTLGAGFARENTTAEVVVSADGRFVYGSNRGQDTLAVFAVDRVSGRLKPAGTVEAGGRTPRHFALDPSGRFLLAAHQDSGSLALFRVDPASGLPAATGETVTGIPRPVCVLFVPVR